MQNEQEENNKPKTLYIASVKDMNPIEGVENAIFYAFDFKEREREKIEDSETTKTVTLTFNSELPSDIINTIIDHQTVFIKDGKFYDKDMNLLYNGKDFKIKE